MGNEHFDFPPVLGADNQPLIVEESEDSLRFQPWYIRFEVVRNGQTRIYSAACNLNNVDDAAVSAYDLHKARIFKVFRTASASSTRNSKLTNLAEDEDTGATGDQIVKASEMRPQERKLLLDLLYPKDWEENPVVLGSNCPDMPDDPHARKAWFERGGVVATAALEAVVMQIDPTGPLAQGKEREKQALELNSKLTETLEARLKEIQRMGLEGDEKSSSLETNSSSPVETTQESEVEVAEAITTQVSNTDVPLAEAGAIESAESPGNSSSATPSSTD